MAQLSTSLQLSSSSSSTSTSARNKASSSSYDEAEDTGKEPEKITREVPSERNKNVEKKTFRLPLCLDMHTHLRQGDLMRLVTPMVKAGGCGGVLVMPNTIPPIVTCAQAKAYWEQLQQLDSSVEYMMTLYLCMEVTAKDLRENAQACHVTGVKCYPRGVTTNAEQGVENLEAYSELFETMQVLGLVLHLHGEEPGASFLDAERLFLPVLEQLHTRFPRLRIVLEHVSTADGIRAVQTKPKDVVAATITPHHLMLTVDDVLRPEFITSEICNCSEAVAQPHNFCKPLAKKRGDREALREVVRKGDPHFFLGSDSAPHFQAKKESVPPAAGVFTQPLLLAIGLLFTFLATSKGDTLPLYRPHVRCTGSGKTLTYLAKIFEEIGCLQQLRSFAIDNATKFFRLKHKSLVAGVDCVMLDPTPMQVPLLYSLSDASEGVVPFMAGCTLPYSLRIVPYKNGDLADCVEL